MLYIITYIMNYSLKISFTNCLYFMSCFIADSQRGPKTNYKENITKSSEIITE